MKKLTYFFPLLACCLMLAACKTPLPEESSTPSGIPETVNGQTPAATASASVTPSPTETPDGPYVAFSADSGFYDKKFNLELTCSEAGAGIYYTTDGSLPDETSRLYTGPIRITNRTHSENVLSARTDVCAGSKYVPSFSVQKGTVIRAIAYLPNGTTTPVANASYFVGMYRIICFLDGDRV